MQGRFFRGQKIGLTVVFLISTFGVIHGYMAQHDFQDSLRVEQNKFVQNLRALHELKLNHAWFLENTTERLALSKLKNSLSLPEKAPFWILDSQNRNIEVLRKSILMNDVGDFSDLNLNEKKIINGIEEALRTLEENTKRGESLERFLQENAVKFQWDHYALLLREYLSLLEKRSQLFEVLEGRAEQLRISRQEQQIQRQSSNHLSTLIFLAFLVSSLFLLIPRFFSRPRGDPKNNESADRESEAVLLKTQIMDEEADVTSAQRFSRQMAHELRNPLQSMSLETECALDLTQDSQRVLVQSNVTGVSGHFAMIPSTVLKNLSTIQENLKGIQEGIGRIQSLADSHLRYGKLSIREKKVLSVFTLIQGCMAECEALFRANKVQCDWQLDSTQNRAIFGDPALLKQLLVNLLKNSVEAMSNVSDANPVDGGKLIRISLELSDRQQLRIFVEDSGPGIDLKIREKLFKPYVTTKTHGNGLGLAFSREVAELHGGTLRYVDREIAGACFEWVVPSVDLGQAEALGPMMRNHSAEEQVEWIT